MQGADTVLIMNRGPISSRSRFHFPFTCACAIVAAGCLLAALAGLASASPGRHTRAGRPSAVRAQRQLPLKMLWGPLTLPNGSSAFPTYHRLGVQVLELQLSWAQTAPTRPSNPRNPSDPAYHWPAALEGAIGQATGYGISLALMVKESPSWANGGRAPSWAPESDADYSAFMQAASRRYPTVHFWMVWGEVTRAGNFNPMPANSPVGPRRYAGLLDAAYGALKEVSASNVVIGGMTYTVGLVSTPDFIRWMRLPGGAPPRLDYYGDNPYSTRFPDLTEGTYAPGVRDINDIDTLHSELAAVYRRRPGGTPRLWLSEFAIGNSPSRAFSFFVDRAEQAQWLTAAFKLVDSTSYVVGLGWYELLDEPASIAGRLTQGLLSAGGAHKPAFSAYAHAP